MPLGVLLLEGSLLGAVAVTVPELPDGDSFKKFCIHQVLKYVIIFVHACISIPF